MTQNRYLCVHSHFYQPPRENPWLERIGYQDSAYPYHDWNDRITVECYAPNALSRVLDEDGFVIDLINNYSKINFNFGPTLLTWLEEFHPDVHDAIIAGDQLSRERCAGHGNAIAQAYNHIILPLANRRDKETQVIWGIKDFEKRFDRYPEGMWLPETAVDTESLEIMAAHGMKYVILAPHQAKEVRELEKEKWVNVEGQKVDITQPYLIKLPGNKSIAAFFYHGEISRAVAFEGLLHNGEHFANRLLDAFKPDSKDSVQLAHIATDGETYGHHHRNGEMALSYALHHIETNNLAEITNYGAFLEKHPPRFEARIFDDSSWSCAHGVERWRNDCGCNSGMQPGSHQKWRKPLRAAFDLLRESMKEPFKKQFSELGLNGWELRNEYVDLILDRSDKKRDAFLSRWKLEGLSNEQTSRLLKALELQRQLLLMYTSCAWFFDEISGIESVQNLQYALRALQLGEELYETSVSGDFIEQLHSAPSNIAHLGNGKAVLEAYAIPSMFTPLKVAAHFAVEYLVSESYQERQLFPGYETVLAQSERMVAGRSQAAVGKMKLKILNTLEEKDLVFVVIHFGDHNLSVGVRDFIDENSFMEMSQKTKETFKRADLPGIVRVIDEYFDNEQRWSLKDLFYDEQKLVLNDVMTQAFTGIEGALRNIHDNNYPLMCFFNDSGKPLPPILKYITEFVKNSRIRHALEEDPPNMEEIRRTVDSSQTDRLELRDRGLGLLFESATERLMDQIEEDPSDIDRMFILLELIRFSQELPFKVNLWSVQNRFFLWKDSVWAEIEKSEPDDELGEQLIKTYLELGESLKVKTPR